MIALALAAGLVIGGSLGALGGGGSILTVPALVYLLGESPHQATTASLVVVGAAALAGAVLHHRAGRVRLVAGIAFGTAGIAGSYLGSRASAAVPAPVLLAGFGALMLVVAVLMVTRRRPDLTAEVAVTTGAEPARQLALARAGGPAGVLAVATAPGPAYPVGRPPGTALAGGTMLRQALVVLAAATGVGLVTGFFGVGGGFVVVPALVLVLGFDMPTAAGTSLVVIAVNSAAALVARLGHAAQQNWQLMAVFAGATIAGTLSGGSLAGRVNPRRLNAAFVALIVLVAAYTLARSLPALA